MKRSFTLRRLFTLFPRRFSSHYWGDNNLHFTRWWQWGRRCFFIRDRIIVRPNFSSWGQIENRVKANDLDACLIKQCIMKLSEYVTYHGMTLPEIYNEMVQAAK